MADQTAEEAITGSLRIRIGGEDKVIPTLKAKYIPEWAKLLDALTPSGITGDPSEGFTLISRVTLGAFLDLITAYDRTAALGGREWLEEHADPRELKAAAEQMADNAFPFGEAAQVVANMVMTRIGQSAALSAPPNSTNGSSTNGASTRRRSGRGSTPRR